MTDVYGGNHSNLVTRPSPLHANGQQHLAHQYMCLNMYSSLKTWSQDTHPSYIQQSSIPFWPRFGFRYYVCGQPHGMRPQHPGAAMPSSIIRRLFPVKKQNRPLLGWTGSTLQQHLPASLVTNNLSWNLVSWSIINQSPLAWNLPWNEVGLDRRLMWRKRRHGWWCVTISRWYHGQLEGFIFGWPGVVVNLGIRSAMRG